MIVYLIRHGQTEWNKKGILQGHKDSPLTPKGKSIAEKHGKFLADKNIEIIYASDLGRCVQVAEIINKHLKVKTIKTRKLRERNFGLLNGESNLKIIKKLALRDSNQQAPMGESFNQLKKRILKFVKSLNSGKFLKILLIIHEGSLRAILTEYYQVDFNSKKCDTQADLVYELQIARGKFKKGSLRPIKI